MERPDSLYDPDDDLTVRPAADPHIARREVAVSRSIWVSAPRPSRQRSGQTLTRDQVAAAAVQLADAGGLEAVTMRSVADKLGISAMSLYWYVESKSQIIELMIDVAFKEQPAPRGRDWRAILRSYARGNRRRFAAHPWLNSTYDRDEKVPSPAQLDLYERTMRALTAVQPDLTARQVSMIIAVVNHVVAGHASVPFPGALAGRVDDPAVRDYLTGMISDGRHPTMSSYAGHFLEFTRDRFDEEIDVVIEGVARYFE